MKYIKVILAVIVGMILMTIIVEGIEFAIVKLISKQSFSYLSTHQEEYFEIRNTHWILVAKLFYSLFAAIIGGYVAAWIAPLLSKIAIMILMSLQAVTIIAAGFFSEELSTTAPTWLWSVLVIVLPLGIWLGYEYWKKRNYSTL